VGIFGVTLLIYLILILNITGFGGMTLPIINLKSRLVNGAGFILQPWITFFQQFTQAPSVATSVNANGSYTAAEPGILAVIGAIGNVTLQRGSMSVSISDNLIPVAIKDVVTWNGPATVTFFPSF
jgi:hypothetical protein